MSQLVLYCNSQYNKLSYNPVRKLVTYKFVATHLTRPKLRLSLMRPELCRTPSVNFRNIHKPRRHYNLTKCYICFHELPQFLYCNYYVLSKVFVHLFYSFPFELGIEKNRNIVNANGWKQSDKCRWGNYFFASSHGAVKSTVHLWPST